MKLVKRKADLGYLDTWMAVPKGHINVESTKRALQFTFYSKYSDQPEVLCLWKETKDHLWFPRTFWQVESLPFDVVDCRPRHYPKTAVTSHIKLDHRRGAKGLVPTGRTIQVDALKALLAAEGGILQLACGTGKTCVALELIARLQAPALIIVDNTHLLEQWGAEIARHLNVPGGVGLVQADKLDWNKDIVLATYQTLASKADDLPNEMCRHFGVVIWDEGHHLAAKTFARSADLFYGRRYILTATAKREDGLSVVYELHVGKVLFKDLSQELKPSIYFRFTGMMLDEVDSSTKVRDKNGELHYKLISSHFGGRRDRLQIMLQDIDTALSNNRKVLYLSESKAEIINLWAMRACGNNVELYSDIPRPTEMDVGENEIPEQLTERRALVKDRLVKVLKKLQSKSLHPMKLGALTRKKELLELRLERDRVYRKIERELVRRQKVYIESIMGIKGIDGLMTYGVAPEKRAWFLTHKRVTFAIAKYGREGLDCQELDTIIISIPFSSRNSMQQLMGRVLRVLKGKLRPVLIVNEDAVGMFQAMCGKLRTSLKRWPEDEGGPYSYQYIDHPLIGANKCQITNALGP